MTETSKPKNRSFINLAIIIGIILLLVGAGAVFGFLDTVLVVLKATGLVMIGITILVTIHELGHFLTAKMFGMRVETFSIGFPPKLFSFTKGETEYQFGATPLGGYVKISGIIDESMDTEHINRAPEPYEFRAKPVWQRLIVMTGGVIMNVILGVIIYASIKFVYGETFIPMSEVEYGIEVLDYIEVDEKVEENGEEKTVKVKKETLGHFLGFRSGDELVNFKGEVYPYFDDYVDQKKLVSSDAYFTVRRNGKDTVIQIPHNVQNYFDGQEYARSLFYPDIPAQIIVSDSISLKKDDKKITIANQAYAGGLRSGDRIVSIDSQPISRYSQLKPMLRPIPNQEVAVEVLRDGKDTMTFMVVLDDKGRLGVNGDIEAFIEPIVYDDYSVWESFERGMSAAFGLLSANTQAMANLFKEDVDVGGSVMGPIQIAYFYLQQFEAGGIKAFMELTGMLSMILAFVNILPIPALDGGHVVFLLIEGITRKEPSTKVRIIAQQVGMVIILGLMVIIIGNDIIRTVF